MYSSLQRLKAWTGKLSVSLLALWTAVRLCLLTSKLFGAETFNLVPVVRAADRVKAGTGTVRISPDDPCLILGEGTCFRTEFTPKMQIMLPKSVNSAVAEVLEVISDTELRIKKEFGGDSGKVTNRLREKQQELQSEGQSGFTFKTLPFVDQQEMYRHVYQSLTNGGAIGIFPEGMSHLHVL